MLRAMTPLWHRYSTPFRTLVNCNPSLTPVDIESKLGAGSDLVSGPILYSSLAGALSYLKVTRLDISYAVHQVCLYMHDLLESYFSALKWILRCDDSDDGEVLNELEGYDGLGSTRRNLVAFVKDVYVFVGSFTYITDFEVLEYIREFIVSDMTDVVMGKPFRKVTKLEYDCTKGLISFTGIFDNYTFQMPRTIPRNAYGKNKFIYKNCLNLGPEYQVDEILGWLLEEIHMTWAQLEKNRQDYDSTPKSLEEFCTVPGDGVAIPSDAVISYKRRRQNPHDSVRT
ncbi:homeodomain-like protein [Tanacetum coccineum]|uniref:Homeodomain-like protein n=1 Tax=Tanacetum coccineum TaxID=301880 RepID=A0ABQ5IJ36_9ASTR